MATSKSTSKKSTTKSRATKAPTKRATTVRSKKVTSNAWELPSGGNYQTFKRSKNSNFFSIRVTDQTIYWAILCFIVLAFGIWVITIDDKVQRIYDQIDAQNASNTAIVAPAKTVKK